MISGTSEFRAHSTNVITLTNIGVAVWPSIKGVYHALPYQCCNCCGSLLSGAAFAQAGLKPTDPQIAHIAYTAGVIDITAAKQALSKSKSKKSSHSRTIWSAIMKR